MSYELNISRGYRYSEDGDFSEIALSEWNAFAESSTDYDPVSELSGKNPATGETFKIKLQNAIQHREQLFVMSWREGVISIKHSEELLPLIKDVAISLKAKVYGEEGETY